MRAYMEDFIAYLVLAVVIYVHIGLYAVVVAYIISLWKDAWVRRLPVWAYTKDYFKRLLILLVAWPKMFKQPCLVLGHDYGLDDVSGGTVDIVCKRCPWTGPCLHDQYASKSS